ncbi:MAG: TonB-dependent receptor plug domain-containing protein [Microscillaceae bacterium]|nr:TonB-dependent receptor plug domain-containing protein [Microscillaceae bacterium]
MLNIRQKIYVAGWLFYLAGFGPGTSLFAQSDSASLTRLLQLQVADMYEQEKTDFLNIQVSIASKKSESLFEVPFATSVVTRENIKRAGVTSIMEALRLMPGLIVQEQSNGNYDIHIRGGSNVQRSTFFSVSGNTTTLVMIDNRPIYNYYLGGTFWETIPIDLNDVERIELVRGPTAAMYGPNAVSGVINIITRQPEDNGFYSVVNAQQGNYDTYLNNASLGYRINKRWDFILSGNWQQRGRHQDTYFDYGSGNYVARDNLPTFSVDPAEAYPFPNLAQERFGVNLFANYQPDAKTRLSLSAGLQDSKVQKTYSENLTSPLTTSFSETRYLDFRARLNHLNAQFSYQNGTQTEGLGAVGQIWDFETYDAVVEYEFLIKNLTLRPGLNFRRALYDDTPYFDIANREGLLNAAREINTFAGYLRGDYLAFKEKLRLVAALRVDRFNFPDQPYWAFQTSAIYKIDPKNIVRISFAQANLSANIINTFSNRISRATDPPLIIVGNQETELLTNDLLEVGYRVQLGNHLRFDLEGYLNQGRNYADFINTALRDELVDGVLTVVQPLETLNTPLQTRQLGLGLVADYNYEGLQVRAFVNYQKTTLINSSPYNYTADASPPGLGTVNPAVENINSGLGTKIVHTGTPTWYGGAMINYRTGRFNFHLNPYFFTATEYYSFIFGLFNNGETGRDRIPGKFILNLRVAYKPTSTIDLFVNIRNLLGQEEREFFHTDRVARMLLAGLNFEF